MIDQHTFKQRRRKWLGKTSSLVGTKTLCILGIHWRKVFVLCITTAPLIVVCDVISSLFLQLIYESFARYLVEHKGYDKDLLNLTPATWDFWWVVSSSSPSLGGNCDSKIYTEYLITISGYQDYIHLIVVVTNTAFESQCTNLHVVIEMGCRSTRTQRIESIPEICLFHFNIVFSYWLLIHRDILLNTWEKGYM